jgi:hydrogenase expression/formation protein HypE
VESGAADGLFVNTAGIGERITGVKLGFSRVEADDAVVASGTMGDHGMTILFHREGTGFESGLKSDCASVASLAVRLLERFGTDVKFMRDPTRGGLAATLNELAAASGMSIEIDESEMPVDGAVRAAADMLGLDVLNIANEGKFVAVVANSCASDFVRVCRCDPVGRKAAVIGRAAGREKPPMVRMNTAIGGSRVVPMPYGRDLPRIC